MPENIVPRKVYLAVFCGLLSLTLLTYELARLHLGPWNLVLALVIAMAKAILVCLFFMHVGYATGLTRIIIVSGLCWLLIFVVLTMSDFATRSGPT